MEPMNFITDALDEILLERELSEAEQLKMFGIYHEIYTTIEREVGFDGGVPTKKWVSGVLNQMGHETGKRAMVLKMMHRGEIDPESEDGKEAKRYEIMMDIMRRKGMAVATKPDSNGYSRIVPPPSQPAYSNNRAKLSDFRNFMSADFNEEKLENDFKKYLRERIVPAAINDTMSKIEDAQGDNNFVEISKNMSLNARSLLRRFIKLSGPKDVSKTREVRLEYKDSPEMLELMRYNLLDGEMRLNRPLVRKFIQFMKDPLKNGSGSNLALRTQNNTNKTVSKGMQHTRHRDSKNTGDYLNVDNEKTGELDFNDKAIRHGDIDDDANSPENRTKDWRDRFDPMTLKAKNERGKGYRKSWDDLTSLG